jgi:hypothetical protein
MIGFVLLAALRQQPDSAVVHAAFREAIVAVYHTAFTSEHSAGSVRLYVQFFQRAGGMAQSADLADLGLAVGPQLTPDVAAKCGGRRCPIISAQRVQASGDTLNIFISVTQWLDLGHPDFASSIGYKVILIRHAWRFVVLAVESVSIS